MLNILLNESTLLLANVNFPREPRGLVWTRASVRRYDGHIVPTKHPLGGELFWFTVTPVDGVEERTDRWAAEQGWISLTPLRLDLTDEAQLRAVSADHPLDDAMAAAVSPPRSSEAAAESIREDEATVSMPVQAGQSQPDVRDLVGGRHRAEG